MVGEYLTQELQDLSVSVDNGVTIKIKAWGANGDTDKGYTEMEAKRPYPYLPTSIEPSAGLHVLNQAVYITISSP